MVIKIDEIGKKMMHLGRNIKKHPNEWRREEGNPAVDHYVAAATQNITHIGTMCRTMMKDTYKFVAASEAWKTDVSCSRSGRCKVSLRRNDGQMTWRSSGMVVTTSAWLHLFALFSV